QISFGGVTDSFTCTDMMGTTDLVPAGTASAVVSLVNSGGQSEAMTTVSVTVGANQTAEAGTVTLTVAAAAGSGPTTWDVRVGTLHKSCTSGRSAATCAGGETATFTLTGLSPVTVPCSDMATTLTNVPAGTYNMTETLTLGATTEATGTTSGIVVPAGGAS